MRRHFVTIIGLFFILLAPSLRAASSCPLDSVLTFNIDSLLTEVTIYDYVVDTARTTVWTVDPTTGIRTGKSREESYSSTLKTMTAKYEWDESTNDWKGKEKFEYVYKYFGGKKMLISSTTFTWLNAAWVADKRLTRGYDSSARETEYFEYKRNTTTNILEPVNGHVYEWLNDDQKTLEEIYTTYTNGAWSAGTKQEWAFDEAGRQTLSTYYGTITNGNWVGTSKEEWGYTDSVLTMTAQYVWANDAWEGTLKEVWAFDTIGRTTLHEQYGWYNSDWSMTLREIADFDEAGNQTLIENYAGANGVTTGTQKEEYTFDENGNKTLIIVYKWSKGAWVGSTHEITEYNGPKGEKSYYEKQVWRSGAWGDSIRETWVFDGPDGKQTLHEKYTWKDGAMVKYLEYTTEYEGAQVKRYENYLLENGVWTGKRFETFEYTNGKKTNHLVYAWEDGAWVNSNQEIWAYNGPSSKQTLHEKYEWENGAWVKTVRDTIGYTGNYITLKESYERQAGVWTGTKKEEYTYTNGKKTQELIYAWDNAWVNSTKEIWTYDTKKRETLHEMYEWNGSWVINLQENTTYDGTNVSAIINYARIEGIWTGTQREEYTYSGGTKTQELIYQWYNNAWMYQTKEEWAFESGHQTFHEKTGWNGSQWIPMEREIAAFDAEGNQTLVENYLLLTTGWTGIKKEEYTYDGSTKTQTIISEWDTDKWVYATKNEKGYQIGNIVVSDADYTWDGSAWVGYRTRTLTTYDEELVIEVLTQNWPSGATEWRDYTRTLNTYNADGVNILTHNAKWNATKSKWVMSSMTRTDIIIDDEDRQLLYASWKCSSDSVWKGVKKDTAAYSLTGKLLYEAHYKSWSNNNWVPIYRVEFAYDEKDREILSQRYEWYINAWEGHYKYEHLYDENGNELMSATYMDWSSYYNNWVGNTKYEYVYDGKKITQKTSYLWSANTWIPHFSYSYQFDAAGHEIEQTVQYYNNGTWENISLYEHAYSGSKEIKSNSYSWENNEWSLYSRYELIHDEDAQGKLRNEITGSWSRGVLRSYADKHYSYSCDSRTIRFVNYDGTLLEEQLLEKGVSPVYSGTTPTKEEDEDNTYTFAGWSPTIEVVTKDATYTATYTAISKDRTITWLNDDGSLINQTTVPFGEMPTHADAEKEATAQYTYTFTGWTPTIVAATDNASYTATFSSTVNQYTITFKDEDGTILDSRLWDYGTTPTCNEPTKAADAHYTYTFSGWSPEVVAVNGEATYVATYSSTVNQYTITFKDEDGAILDSRLWDYGATPTCTEPTKQATAEYTYTFAGWSPAVVAVNGNATYTATYSITVHQYTVTFKDEDGTILDSRLWDYGATPSCTEPTKAADAHYSYTFAGWSPAVGTVSGEATYIATYSSTVNQYTITFKDEDGAILDSRLWDYGAAPTCTEPTKAADAHYTYTFSGWSPAVGTVTGEATYVATYSSTVNQYTITFKDEDGSTLDSRLWDYNATPTCTEPSKETTAEYTYTFAGWSPEVAAVTGNATYTATYSSSKNSYTITWLDDEGTEIDHTTVEFGLTPTHANIEKESTDEYTYSFAGWSPAIVPVTGDATYQATFTASKRSYLITFYYENGTTILDQVMVEYGATPATSLIPSSPSDAHYSYTFAGWAPEVVPVTGEASYVATYTAIPNKYTITFKNYNGRVLERTKVEYGATPEYEGETPFRPATASCVYEFAGWSPEIAEVIGDATYTAVFEAIINTYTIIFFDEDGITELDRTIVEYGQKPTTEVVPTKPEDEEFTYTFAGWNPKIVKATADASYVATYTAKSKTTPEGVSNVNAASEQVTKVIIDGQIFILRGGHTYSIDGVLVR